MHGSPGRSPPKPKGILKNSKSRILDTVELDEKDLTLQNTRNNVGGGSSVGGQRASSATSRHSVPLSDHPDAAAPRLQWDETNINSHERGTRMKITEPKTPFPPQYDPAADGLSDSDIPDFQLGEPANNSSSSHSASVVDWDEVFNQNQPRVTSRRSSVSASVGSSSAKHVSVNPGDEPEAHDAESLAGSARHEEFEEKRRKHYEMHNIRDLLAKKVDVDEDDDDDDDDDEGNDENGDKKDQAAHKKVPPPVPEIPAQYKK